MDYLKRDEMKYICSKQYMSNDKLQKFEDQPIRTVWDEETEEWYFSFVDVVSVLTYQATARNASTYWAVLKKRLKEEGADQLLTNCKQLKLKSHKDGKRYRGVLYEYRKQRTEYG